MLNADGWYAVYAHEGTEKEPKWACLMPLVAWREDQFHRVRGLEGGEYVDEVNEILPFRGYWKLGSALNLLFSLVPDSCKNTLILELPEAVTAMYDTLTIMAANPS